MQLFRALILLIPPVANAKGSVPNAEYLLQLQRGGLQSAVPLDLAPEARQRSSLEAEHRLIDAR